MMTPSAPALLLLACFTPHLEARQESSSSPQGNAVPFKVEHRPDRQRYVCYKTEKPLVIDGVLNEEAWQAAPNTRAFVDIEGSSKPAPTWKTTAKMLWDDQYFYVSADLEEPHLWSLLTERDSVIFHDNDFEVFIDPDGDTQDYYELEINALGTEWDLLLERPYRDGGTALHAFDTPGLISAVHMRGTVNDARDVDQGWSVEIAIPWAALAPLAPSAMPPQDKDVWWVNFSRVEWDLDFDPKSERANTYSKRLNEQGKHLPEHNWVWSPQGVIAMHEPESWGLVMFASTTSKSAKADRARKFVEPLDIRERALLRAVYTAQKIYRNRSGSYADQPAQLGVRDADLNERRLSLHPTPSGFEAVLHWQHESNGSKQPMRLRIDEVGHIW
jgi:hypothetical protein